MRPVQRNPLNRGCHCHLATSHKRFASGFWDIHVDVRHALADTLDVARRRYRCDALIFAHVPRVQGVFGSVTTKTLLAFEQTCPTSDSLECWGATRPRVKYRQGYTGRFRYSRGDVVLLPRPHRTSQRCVTDERPVS